MSTNQKLAAGTVLGRYELLLPIAQGGMATVWAARQKGSRGFQKTVAVKTMLPNLSDDPQFEQMFLDEASLAARIHHPNVAEILDLGEQDDILYIVMEWVDGEALSVIHKTAKKNATALPQRIALRVVCQACAGLHAAHELKDENDHLLDLVHRDVSPQNVLVGYDGIVKLVDFGVAKAIGRAGGETSAGQLKGKVPYMSPEQAKGGKVDRRTDVFAMGIVLYKLMTGVHPFLGDNDVTTLKNIISRPVLSPRVKAPNLAPELESVIMKSLAKDPAQRYPTILDLERAIDKCLAVSGASVVDDDVGSFVRAVMGDRGAKRRAALRDAVRAADERAAGIAGPMAQPHVHDSLSDALITRMNSSVRSEILGDRSSQLPPSVPGDSSTAPTTVNRQPEFPEEPVELFMIPDGAKRRRKMIALGGTSVALALGAFLALRAVSGRGAETAPAPTSAPASPVPERATVAAAAIPPPPAAPAADTAEAAQPVAISDLPSADDKPAKRPVGGAHAAPKQPAAEKPAAEKPAAEKPAAAKPAGTTWVPTVQNPGF